jgi:TatD DNase family protein
MIFDTHCHGYWSGLAHRQDDVLRNMKAEGVLRSVQIGTGVDKSRLALALAREWGSETWCAAAIHPAGCQDLPESAAPELMLQLEALITANRDKMVAVGETGLDYFHVTHGREAQQKRTQRFYFEVQAALALRLDLPLVIHTRDAARDTIAVIKEHGVRRAVIHCFSEDLAFAQELMQWSDGIYFSFSGILTYKRAVAVQDAARSLPLNRILVETDAPYLVPQVLRDSFTVNEPAFTRHIMDFLKTLRSEPAEVVERTVWDNSNRFFNV